MLIPVKKEILLRIVENGSMAELVYRTCLENKRTVTRSVGSNPTATTILESWLRGLKQRTR